MNAFSAPFSAVQRLLHGAAGLALRLAATLFGLALMAGMVLLGLVAGGLLLLWALVRGRQPQWQRFGGMPPRAGWPMRGRAGPVGDVVDIEAREVKPPGTP